jgi:site-specific DNA recombinase
MEGGQKMRAAIYCRVSTEGQEQEGTSLQTQLEACQKYCQKKGYEVAYELSDAYSGLSLERPKLAELRELARTEEIDVLVVYSLDRLSRDPVHGVILMQELEKHQVLLEAASETVDNSEVGKLVFYIKGYAAKLDAERRRDATGRGKKALLKAGKLPQGTGIGVYGYNWIKEYKKRITVEREAKVVKRIFDMAVNEVSCYKIACALNEESIPTKTGKKWEPRTIYRILRNPAYCGLTYFGVTSLKDGKRVNMPTDSWTLLPDATPAIINKELFDRVQAVAAKSKELHPGRAAHEYLLTGFAECEYCGSPLVGTCLRGQYRYYHCRGTSSTTNRPKICDAHYIKADWLEESAWEYVKGVMRKPEVLFTETSKQMEDEKEQLAQGNLEQEIRNLNRKLKGYAGQERRLMNALRMEAATQDIVLDELNQMKKEREADKAKIDKLLKAKESLAKSGDFEAQVREFCVRIAPDLDNCTSEDKKDAYKYLDLHVKAKPEGADIKGYVDPSVLMGGQSSGCLHGRNSIPFFVIKNQSLNLGLKWIPVDNLFIP